MAHRESHYKYLEKYYPVFWKSLTGKHMSMDEASAILTSDGDKCYQYEACWAAAGIHFFNGCMLYLLTHTFEYGKEVRHQTDGGWIDPRQWAIDNYSRFRIHMPHPLTPHKQTVLKTETTRGNCMATALAVVTQQDPSTVPAFETMGEHWHQPFFKWINSIGFRYTPTRTPTGLCIANGMSKRNTLHSVVTVDGGFFHDPHPDDVYLETINQYWRIESVAQQKVS